MKYSKATDYALHTMLFLTAATPQKPIGVQQLAERKMYHLLTCPKY